MLSGDLLMTMIMMKNLVKEMMQYYFSYSFKAGEFGKIIPNNFRFQCMIFLKYE